ncbi:MAG: DUF6624 domain-containing protein [Bacteroidota bacterium]
MNKLFLIAILTMIASTSCSQNFESIKQELLVIHKEDQDIRHEWIAALNHPTHSTKTIDSLGKIMETKDSVNIIHVSRILDDYGWLGKDKIGPDANQTLFLVVQHSDLEIQQKYLPMIRKASLVGDASKSHLALLEDRVALREGKMQIYGSQVGQFLGSKEYYILPLKDPETVDVRRAEVGLQPLADYVKQWKIVWDPQAYIKQLPKIKELNGFK